MALLPLTSLGPIGLKAAQQTTQGPERVSLWIAVSKKCRWLCSTCEFAGYCRNQIVEAVTASTLATDYVRDGRIFLHDLSEKHRISCREFPDYLYSCHNEFIGKFVHPDDGHEVHLNTEVLFFNEADLKDELNEPEESPSRDSWLRSPNLHSWYRDNLNRPCPDDIRISNRKRWAVIFSIVRATFPEAEAHFGSR